MSSGVIRVLLFENSALEVRSIIGTLGGEGQNPFAIINVPRFQDSPRSLVQLLLKALREKTTKVKAIVRKGRWVLWQAMGCFAANYRQVCLVAGQSETSVSVNIPNDCRRRS